MEALETLSSVRIISEMVLMGIIRTTAPTGRPMALKSAIAETTAIPGTPALPMERKKAVTARVR